MTHRRASGTPALTLFSLLVAATAQADNQAYFDHNYVNAGIVRGGESRIAPVVNAPERKADQMLQTEAVPEPRDRSLSRRAPAQRHPGNEGRFVVRQGGTEPRRVPHELGEIGTDLP